MPDELTSATAYGIADEGMAQMVGGWLGQATGQRVEITLRLLPDGEPIQVLHGDEEA